VVAKEQVTLFGLPIVAGRRVHFGPIDPVQSRELFIRRALVEGEFRTSGDFFAHNRTLVEEVEELEARARKRDILVDEERLFAFYDERIPAGIVNGKGFEAWRKQAEASSPDILKFDRTALLAREAGDVTEADTPDELMVKGVRYPLSYHFQPGAPDDGVTLTVPAAMLPQLPLARLEWLVPGLLREKCIALMKSLPKAIRRQVVPIPDWVDAALEALAPEDAPLTQALGDFLRRKTGVRVHPDDWHPESLEPHLLMNLRVVDHHGKLLGQGRDARELERHFEAAAGEGARALAAQVSDEEDVEALPETPLPESRVTTQAGIRVEAFPALVPKGEAFRVELYDHPDKAREAHRDGVVRLAMRRLPDQVRAIERLKGVDTCALLFAKVSTRRQLSDDLVQAVFQQVVAVDPLPRGQRELESRLEATRDDLLPRAEALVTTLEQALKGHLAVTKALKGNLNLALALVYSDLKAQMQRLVHPGFISEAGDWLEEYPRYMEAALIRLEKAPRERMRDQMHMQEVQEFEMQLAARRESERRGGVEDPALVAFGWWIEELRVSLFAQQLGTKFPVSPKRLEKHWGEITGKAA